MKKTKPSNHISLTQLFRSLSTAFNQLFFADKREFERLKNFIAS